MPAFSAEFWVGTAFAAVALLAGIAVAIVMVESTKGEFRFVVFCFLFSSALVVYGIGVWEVSVTWPTRPRIIAGTLAFAIVAMLTTEIIRWAHGRHLRAGATLEAPPSGGQPPSSPGTTVRVEPPAETAKIKPHQTKSHSSSLKDSLVINALAGYGNYVEGSTIGSVNPIKWKNYYSEVQVIFVNTSSEDYDAFDVSVDPDQVIFAVSQITEIPGVSIFSLKGGPGSQLPPPEETKPLPPNSVLLLPNNIDSSPRRVRCEKFPASIPMRLIFAVANVKFPPGSTHGHTLMFGFGTPDLNPKALPQWVKIEGSYKLQGQKFHVSKTVEFTQAALP